MANPLFVTTPASSGNPILIIDKEGTIGISLVDSLRLSFLPLLVSSQHPENQTGIVSIPYHKSFPRLPKNKFSHIVVVSHGERELLRKLPSLVKIARQSNCRILLISSMYNAQEEMVKKTVEFGEISLLVYGDLFGTIRLDSPHMSLLHQAKKHKKILLPDTGLKELYPLSLSDLVTIILETLLSGRRERILFASFQARTQLSLVRMLQQADPLIQMDFSKKSPTSPASYIPPSATHIIPSHPPLSDRLREYLAEETQHHFPPPPQKKKRKMNRTSQLLIAVFLSLILLPFVFTIVGIVGGFGAAGVSLFTLEKGELAVSKQAAGMSYGLFTFAEPSEQVLRNLSRSLGFPSLDPLSSVMTSGKSVSGLLVNITSSISTVEQGMMGRTALSPDQLTLSLKRAVIDLQTLEAQGFLPEFVEKKLKKEERSLSLLINLSDVAPLLLGHTAPKTYAVLFQNNMELRAGGGFIGSFGLVKMNKGKMDAFTIHDVYDADGQLKGHVEPPYQLKRYLGAAHWFLRDSNVSLDSAENATQAAKFLQLEMGEKIDGVLAVDLSFFQALLELTGPITMPDYHITVTKDNMFHEIESHAEDNFFPGSTQKKDFLSTLSQALLNKLSEKSPQPFALSQVLTDAIYQKHVMATSLDPQIQPLLLRNRLVSTPRTIPSGDVFGVVEDNVGANKANYFLKRSIEQEVELKKDRSASESVSITYTNTSNGDKFGGDYKAYLQLILPKNATILGIEINGTEQHLVPAIIDPAIYSKTTFKAPKGLEVAEDIRYNKAIIGFPWQVVEGETRVLTIYYTVSNIIISEGKNRYLLSYFKQPGREKDDYSLSVSYPKEWEILELPEGAEKKAREVVFHQELREDTQLLFTFED